VLGVSARTVERGRAVLADPEAKAAVIQNGKSVNAAATIAAENKREAAAAGVPVTLTVPGKQEPAAEKPAKPATKPTFNYQTSDGIEWAKWSWNPVTGCLHDCGYCYAREIANRYYPEKFAPTYHPERLSAPHNTKQKPAAATDIGERNVFVGSMADLFGHWVPQEWIDAVLDECRKAPQWNFLFLSKNPKRYVGIDWPANAWVGTTVDEQKRVLVAERAFAKFQAPVKFLSCEPLLEPLTFTSLEMFDWIIIGGQSANSQVREFQPPWEWVESLVMQARAAGCKVYLKPNLKTRPKEYPIGALREPSTPDPHAAADLAKELGDDGDGA
jgi:protein gp37